MKKNNNYTIGSDNLFADVGVSNPEERLAKANLASQINNLIKQKNLSQTEAAKLLDVDQPKISALSTGKLSGFSLERLFRFLNILDQDITIKITPKKLKHKANVTVRLTKIKKSPAAQRSTVSPKAATVQARKKNK